ncbi:MAG: hypothetical protein J0M25_00680 [Flavobacteriales bacterium]|nr:hypothetical protein [Flavobacteriales bacterium]
MKHFKNIHVGKSTVAVTGLSSKPKVPAPKKVKFNIADITVENKVVSWGIDNLYPQKFYKKFLKNGAAVGGVGALKSTHYGTGMSLVLDQANEAGDFEKTKQSLRKYPQIYKFFKDNRLQKFWYEKITDQTLFHISFTEHCLSVDQNTIVRTKRLKAAHCRFTEQNKDGIIEFVVLNTDWVNYDEKYNTGFYFADPDMTVEELKTWVKEKKIYNFVTASVYPLVDETYYPNPDWHAVDRSGWMDVANSVPELKQALFENQLHFKYIVYVSDYYFESFYKEEWDDFDAEKRQKMREDLSRAIDDHLSGNKGSGRSIVSPIFEENGKFVKGIEVAAVDNKLKDGSYLPDASAANTEILFAMGVDPVIVGAGTPGSVQGRSGSDKREAYTILSANLTPRRHITLDDFELWKEWNGWPEELEGVFPSVNLTTLDKNPNGQVEVIN